jgi:hypothetical protein
MGEVGDDPEATGSLALSMTMGVSPAPFFAAPMAGSMEAAMTSTFRLREVARARDERGFVVHRVPALVQRYSMARLRPSM